MLLIALVGLTSSCNQKKDRDTIEVLREKIEDWSISNERKNMYEGSFTEKYLFDNE